MTDIKALIYDKWKARLVGALAVLTGRAWAAPGRPDDYVKKQPELPYDYGTPREPKK